MAERDFAMPDLGEGLEEGRVTTWLVAEGDGVGLNQPFVEIETAKATVEIPSPLAGRVLKLHAADGETVKVGALLVTFDVDEVGDQGPSMDVATRPRATPAVRKLAKDLGVELGTVVGGGPGGRVEREDVEAAARGGLASSAVSPEADEVPITPMRRAIAENLSRAAAIPQVTTFRTVDCTEVEVLRRELGISPLPVLVGALARISADHPMLNAWWGGDRILVHRHVHAGVAIDTERGLVVPVVRNAEDRGIAGIADEIERLVEAARSGELVPEDVTGATIAVTNTGSYGSEAGTPLLNPGTAVTVGLGVVAPRALVVDGELVARPACTLSVTFDHRVLDGAAVGRGLTDLVNVLQTRDRLRSLPR
jgi:2-oxoisovalerate dehydrogenase E2 component (dihydrolipoyl transacylase)